MNLFIISPLVMLLSNAFIPKALWPGQGQLGGGRMNPPRLAGGLVSYGKCSRTVRLKQTSEGRANLHGGWSLPPITARRCGSGH